MRQGQVYSGQAFATLYTYLENDLGVTVSGDHTAFRLWAPTAATANVLLYDTGQAIADETPRSIPMHRGEGGTWTVRVADDLKGKFYTYQVQIDGRWSEAVDPYARAVGLNGNRGKIIDLPSTDPPGWARDERPRHNSPTDAVIYELHVRDLSAHPQSGIRHKGKFLGLTEAGTATPGGVKTGLDHIAELGVTHVHLLPCFDFSYEEDSFAPPGDVPYNWGYNPKNYNAPEDSYATNPIDGVSAVRELKRLVQALHSRGIGVILDVVYNHVYDADSSCFGILAPGYYFRMKTDGAYSNGSGCGNETASERVMTRKFILDSISYWAKEYHVDGFRFDLMGLHDIETMNLIRKRLDEIDPGILLYGEGWTGGQSVLPPAERAVKDNASRLDARIALFSDDIRDSIKGGVYDAKAPGFVNGAAAERAGDVKFGIAAAVEHPQVDPGNRFWAKHPTQTITYNSCHDNLTLWDKLVKTNPTASTKELTAMNRLAAAIVLTSQGLVLLHAGEEMARTKNGSDNSYNLPDAVNRLDWPRKRDFIGLYEYYKGLIAIRRAYPAFRMADADSLRARLRFLENDSPAMVAYTLDGGSQPDVLVALNGGPEEQALALPAGKWAQLADSERAGLTPLSVMEGTLSVPPCGAAILILSEPGPAAQFQDSLETEKKISAEELPVTAEETPVAAESDAVVDQEGDGDEILPDEAKEDSFVSEFPAPESDSPIPEQAPEKSPPPAQEEPAEKEPPPRVISSRRARDPKPIILGVAILGAALVGISIARLFKKRGN